ncbi:hypothetical protein [Vibrio scophthalmi]
MLKARYQFFCTPHCSMM